jgi:thiamine-phosphate pyrophosphorylase
LKKTKKFIYLISPNTIENDSFYKDLELVFITRKVAYFQLRLKKDKESNIIYIGKKIKQLCNKYNVKLLINDNPILAKKIGSDGCHLGQNDMSIHKARKILKNKIIGLTCHNSKSLILKAITGGADYIALGSFFITKTKKVKYKADINILRYAKNITDIPIVAIGGIKLSNYKKLLLNKANFLAISSYIWNNKKLKPEEAIIRLK